MIKKDIRCFIHIWHLSTNVFISEKYLAWHCQRIYHLLFTTMSRKRARISRAEDVYDDGDKYFYLLLIGDMTFDTALVKIRSTQVNKPLEKAIAAHKITIQDVHAALKTLSSFESMEPYIPSDPATESRGQDYDDDLIESAWEFLSPICPKLKFFTRRTPYCSETRTLAHNFGAIDMITRWSRAIPSTDTHIKFKGPVYVADNSHRGRHDADAAALARIKEGKTQLE